MARSIRAAWTWLRTTMWPDAEMIVDYWPEWPESFAALGRRSVGCVTASLGVGVSTLLRMRFSILWLLVGALTVVACGGESADTTATTAPTTTTSEAPPTTAADDTTTTDATTTTTGATTTTEAADPYTFDIVIEGTTVTGGGTLSVPVGETVTLRITSDIADEVHIHGYDLVLDLEAGVQSEISFAADIPGVFEIETHHSRLVIANLEAS